MNTFETDTLNEEKLLHEILFPTLPYRSVPKDYSEAKNVNSEICAECGGDCCKRCGCHFSPDDFAEISFYFLKKEIEKGYISIGLLDRDTSYADVGIYFLRIRNQNAPIVDLGYKSSPCILLTETGCKLPYHQRPTGGKLLIPSANVQTFFGEQRRTCFSLYGIEKCSYEWKPHQAVLYDLAQYFKDKDFPCSL